MDKLVLSFIAVWTVAWCGAHASIVRSKREISVQIGRSVYIHPDDLVLDGGTTCKVELDVFDPISQRVGTLEPKAFDCRFQPKSVKYIHNGSPLLKRDSIKLRVHKFSNRETVTEIVYLKINILNEAYDVFVIGNPSPLAVPTFSGYSNAIDASILRFRYDMRNNATCMVGFSHYGTNYPLVGQIVMGQDNTPIDALWRECHEFLFLGLKYQHLVPPTPDMDYIPLKVQVNDPLKGIIIERLYLPIIITGAFPNVPPKAAFMKAYLMDVDQFVLSIVSPNIMGAEDDETPEPQLIYNISRPLGPGEGYLVNLADHTRPITSFLQADLSNLNIAYQPPNISYTDRTNFIVEFTVYDSHFAKSAQPTVLHISVRPSETKAPRVALNAGLTLIEGHSATIRPDNLQIVDKDNIDRVHCLVKAGLLHGDILVNGRKQMSFSPRDIEMGHVVYYHDDTDTSRDQVLLRISDGLHSIQTTLFIHIIPKDDSPPTLVNNIDLDVAQGELVQFKEQKLSAHDSDSNDYDIVYKITSAPAFGEIKRKISSDSPGHIASKFTEEELMKGFIYYKQSKDTDSLTDVFKFTLLDQNQPPNESGEYVTMIHIHPKKNFPPRKVQNTEGSIVTKESDVVFIDKYHLGFEDPDSKDEEIIYSITAQPYFVDSQETLDAGRIINTKNLSMVMKNPLIPGISSFTQAEINYMKIAYMPPMKDIGTDPRLVRFHYTVSDLSGNVLTGLTFQITLMPVNDQIPQLMINPLSVKEGESVALTTNEIFVMDVDTKMENLVLTFDAMPSRGLLKKDGIVMAIDDQFSVNDLKRRKIMYYHDGSDDSAEDSFGVTVSDGMFRLSKAIPIHIQLIDDQLPYLTSESSSQLIVTEGGETFITPAVLSAKDQDTPASKITYIIVQPPTKGSILKGRQNINRFTQQEIDENQIKYMHRSGEIGYNSETDAFKFIIADKILTSMQDVSIYQLNVTILPVNDRAPKIVLGNPLIVKEGGTSPITFDILGAQDVDTKSEELVFLIEKLPEWGFVENTRPNPGSEKSNAGISIQKFTIKDLQEGKINYVQANHNKVEPLTDQMVIKVTDGEFFSRETLLTINIIPQNDETPVIEMTDIVVEEGHEMSIDNKILTISDLDEPADRLMVSVVQEPDYGKIKMMIERKQLGGEEMVEIPMHDFAARDMQKDMRLYYKHDGSETSDDQFTIEVSDGAHTVRKTAKVHVKRMNDETPQVIKNAGLRILYGEAAFVSSAILKAWDIDNGPEEVNYILARKPKRGVLQKRIHSPLDISQDGILDPDVDDVNGEWEEISEGMNFTQLQINKNLIRYTHTGDMGLMQADNFRFIVTDGKNFSPEESFEIEIEHSQVSEIALLAKGMKVKEGQRVVIATDILSAEDGTDLFNRIKFNILHPPLFGQIESLNAPGKALKEFSQLDLAARRIAYVHTSRSESIEDWFKFKVSNGYQAKNGTLFIHIIPTDRITPTLLKNNVLFIKRGTERVISSTYLLVTDPDTKSTNLTFFIMKAPDHGELLNKGIKIIQKFTQDDVDNERITYKNFGSQAEHDYFWFAMTDNKHIGFLVNGSLHLDPVKFTVALISLDPTPPIILRNKQPTMLDSFERKKVGYIINSRFLKVTSSHEPAANLQFIITAKPKFGHLEDVARSKVIKKRFTQTDIDNGRVAYIIDSKNKSVTYDSFMFKVIDSKRNELAPQRFGMSWPVIEFTRLEYIVCEDVGTLSVGLRRVGETSQSSYISVSVREMSAKAGEDFGSQTAAQIQFDPGVKIVSWDIAIRDDGLPEGKEMFKLLLRSPVNALIGEYDRATIRIINRNNAKGRCIEVPGMIHKGGIVPENTNIKPSSILKTDKETVYTFHGISGLKTDKKSSSRDENDDDEDAGDLALDAAGNMKPLNDGTGAGASSSGSGSTAPRSMKANRKRGRKRKDKKKKNMTRKQKKIARFWERRDRMKKKQQKKLREKGERVALRKKKNGDGDDDDSEEVKAPKGKGSRRRRKEKSESSRRQETPDASTSWMYNGGKGASSLSTDTDKDSGRSSGRSSSYDRSSSRGSKSDRGSTSDQSAVTKTDSGRGLTDDKMKEVFNSMDGRVMTTGEVDSGEGQKKKGKKNKRRRKKKDRKKKKGDEGTVDEKRVKGEVEGDLTESYGPADDNEGEDLDMTKISQSNKKVKGKRDKIKKEKLREKRRKIKEKKKRQRMKAQKQNERLKKQKEKERKQKQKNKKHVNKKGDKKKNNKGNKRKNVNDNVGKDEDVNDNDNVDVNASNKGDVSDEVEVDTIDIDENVENNDKNGKRKRTKLDKKEKNRKKKDKKKKEKNRVRHRNKNKGKRRGKKKQDVLDATPKGQLGVTLQPTGVTLQQPSVTQHTGVTLSTEQTRGEKELDKNSKLDVGPTSLVLMPANPSEVPVMTQEVATSPSTYGQNTASADYGPTVASLDLNLENETDSIAGIPITDDRMSVDMPAVDQQRPRPLSDDSTVKKPGSHGYKNSKLSADDLEKGLLSSRKPSESDLAEGSGAAGEIVYVNDCTPATKGMLHLDPATSLIYKCDGYDWLSLEDEFRAAVKSTAPSTPTESPTVFKTVVSASECLPGWLKSNGRCYKPFDEQMTWSMAQKQCRQFSADLPSIWAMQQLDWLWRLIGQDRFWIGLNCMQTFKKWEYSNGDPVTFTYWRTDYPRGGPLTGKNCVLVREDKFWTNRPCSTLRAKFVCSKLPLSIHRTRN